jgi:thiol-disulfide isomerase/thioredoxin
MSHEFFNQRRKGAYAPTASSEVRLPEGRGAPSRNPLRLGLLIAVAALLLLVPPLAAIVYFWPRADTNVSTQAGPTARARQFDNDPVLTKRQDAPRTTTPSPTPATGGLPAQDAVSQAQNKVRQNDIDGAIQVLEEAHAKEPTNAKLLVELVKYTQQRGMQLVESGQADSAYAWMRKSGEYLRRLMQQENGVASLPRPVVAMVLYNEACGLAMNGQKEQALASLNQALEMGFSQLELLKTDTDLNALRDMPEFKTLLSKTQEKALAAAKTKAQSVLADNKPFDFSFELPSIDGKTVSLTDYAGKVLIVDVWGTWCPPCRQEIPHFVELHKKYRDKGLEIVGINYEHVEKDKVNETVKDFVKANGVTYTCVIGDDQTKDRIPDLRGFPTTLFLDRTGKVRGKVVGYQSLVDLEAIVTLLLDEKTPAGK